MIGSLRVNGNYELELNDILQELASFCHLYIILLVVLRLHWYYFALSIVPS